MSSKYLGFHNELSHLMVVGLALACLTACASPPPTAPTSVTSESTSTPTQPTLTPTLEQPTSTATVSPTNTPFPPTPESQPTPDIFDQPIANRLLLTETQDCRLPCWYGLHVGESHLDETESKLRQALNLSPDYAFAKGTTPEGDTLAYFADGHWSQKNASPEQMYTGVLAYFDPETQIVTKLAFGWYNYTRYPTTPGRIMQVLGEPTNVWLDFQITEAADVASLRAQFYFAEKNFSMTVGSLIPVQLPAPGNAGAGVRKAQWCLNGGTGYKELSFGAEIYPPLDSKLPVLNQERAFALQSTQKEVDKGQLAPLENIVHMTPKELYQRVIQDGNTCVEFEF